MLHYLSAPIQHILYLLLDTVVLVPSGTPLSFMATSISTRKFVLSWNVPEIIAINGILRKYILSVSESKSNLFLLEEIEIDADYSNETIFNLIPYTQYNCSIAAVTIDIGPSAIIQVVTNEEGKNWLNSQTSEQWTANLKTW